MTAKKLLYFLLFSFTLVLVALLSACVALPPEETTSAEATDHTAITTAPVTTLDAPVTTLPPTEGLAYTLLPDNTYEVSIGDAVRATEIVIPSTYKGLAVTAIAYRGFWNAEQLTSVVIPEGVTTIGGLAFAACTSLKTLMIPNSVREIGAYAFKFNDLLSYHCYDNGLYLGNEENPYHVFVQAKDRAITSCDIHEDTKIICGNAFLMCTELREVAIPDGIERIEPEVFIDCRSLTYNSYGNGLYLGNEENPYVMLMMAEDAQNTACEIHPDTKVIYEYAFGIVKEMTEITIPIGVRNIGDRAFLFGNMLTIYCEAPSKPEGWSATWNEAAHPVVWNCRSNAVADDGAVYATVNGVRYAFRDGVATVVGQPYSITSITIPRAVIYRGKEYPVTSVAARALRNCGMLTSLTVPDSIISVGASAFSSNALTLLCEAASLPEGWGAAFDENAPPVVWDCKNNTVADDGAVYAVVDGIRYAFRDGVATVVGQPVSITSATIPETVTYEGSTYRVTSIAEKAFLSCNRLTSVTIPSSVESIGDQAFYGCRALRAAAIPEGVKAIGEYLFAECEMLEAVTIPSSVESIGAYAFARCLRLTSLSIPKSVKRIEVNAFSECESLTALTFDEAEGWRYNGGSVPSKTMADPAAAAKKLTKDCYFTYIRE